jgi:hypothetical protein
MSSKPSPRNSAQSMLAGLVGRGEEVFGVFLEELGRTPRCASRSARHSSAPSTRNAPSTECDGAVGVERAVARRLHRILTKIENLQGAL